MELRGQGWGVRAAAREVGVARVTVSRWASGYKAYRNGCTPRAIMERDVEMRCCTRCNSARFPVGAQP